MNPNPELIDDDNPQWTEADFKKAVSFSQLPQTLQNKLAVLTPETSTVQLENEVLERFKATGENWQAMMNTVLKQWLNEHAL
jgi:uncharacterized protein (DUF4415 family)